MNDLTLSFCTDKIILKTDNYEEKIRGIKLCFLNNKSTAHLIRIDFILFCLYSYFCILSIVLYCDLKFYIF